jgi:hypothetical protein
LENKLGRRVSDTGVFIITAEENSKRYEEDFYPVDAEGIDAYGIRFKDGVLMVN